jgi:hypothetical protein
MNNDTTKNSKTYRRRSPSSERKHESDAQRSINRRLKSFTYASKSDLSCIALDQVEMDLVFESIQTAIALTEAMDDDDAKDWALPRLRKLRVRFAEAP